ncbi:hypothetical protein LCGC14_3036510 [marine sediment metagenome]|uniref:Uncharacterized protein n=1 Tax=marine sediment metagenome TaxID=412755 RepID=A0A0F8WRB9_9ZZZZ
MNKLPKIDYSDLIQKYGEKNVENTCIYIVQFTDPKGLAVNIWPTCGRVAEILDVVHREFLTKALQTWIEEQHPLDSNPSSSCRDKNSNPYVAFSLGWVGDQNEDSILDLCKQEHEKYLGQLPNREGKLHWRVKPEIGPDVDFSNEKKTKIYWRLSVS